MATRNSNIRPRLAAKLLLPAALGITLLAACSSLNKPSAKAPAKATGATEEKMAAGDLKFPQATCGEEASTPSENWYPVFIDGAELTAIRSQYCGNAISEVRSKTGVPTVQVASFTSYEKAKRFAAAVGGEVDVVGSLPGAKPGSSQANSSTQQDLTTGKTATLASAETGSPINIRQSASTDASVQEVAYSGDAIKVASKTQGTDGYTWYKVELDSGASGWVRSDLIGSTTGSTTGTSASSVSTASNTTRSASRDTASPTTDAASTTIASAPPSTASPSTTAASTPSSTSSTGASTRSTTASSSRTATIASSDPSSPINVRSGAGTDAEVQDVAYGGDRIQITESKQGDDGQTWYKVEFESGTSGWVRSDFIGN